MLFEFCHSLTYVCVDFEYVYPSLFQWQPDGRRLFTGAHSTEITMWDGLAFNFIHVAHVWETIFLYQYPSPCVCLSYVPFLLGFFSVIDTLLCPFSIFSRVFPFFSAFTSHLKRKFALLSFCL
jgi:hypothetical protein